MEELLRRSILTLMKTPETTFLDLLLLLVSPEHRQHYTSGLTDKEDAELRHFWEVQFPLVARNSRALAEALYRLYDNKLLRRHLLHGVIWLSEHFLWGKISYDYLQFLQCVIGEKDELAATK